MTEAPVEFSDFPALATVPPDHILRERGSKQTVNSQEIQLILSLRNYGRHPHEIGEALNISTAKIKQVLLEWSDKRLIAKQYLRAQADKLAETVAQTDDAAVALKALGKLDVVREDRESAGTGVIIQVGAPGQPLSLPDLSPLAIEAPKRK